LYLAITLLVARAARRRGQQQPGSWRRKGGQLPWRWQWLWRKREEGERDRVRVRDTMLEGE
jgi:hypothetical protein